MASTHTPVVRKAVPEDEPAILALVDALADYEKLPRPSSDARNRLIHDLFGPKPRIECFLVFMDGYPVGYAILLETYSSFLALPTLYLEDLFVIEEYRRRRAGRASFRGGSGGSEEPRLRPHGMDRARLESARDRFLQQVRRPAHGRVATLPNYIGQLRRSARAGRRCLRLIVGTEERKIVALEREHVLLVRDHELAGRFQSSDDKGRDLACIS